MGIKEYVGERPRWSPTKTISFYDVNTYIHIQNDEMGPMRRRQK